MQKQRSPKEIKPSHTDVSFSVHGGNYSHTVKDKYVVSSTKTVETGTSKSFRVSSDVSQKTQASSQRSCDEKSHQRTSSKVKSPLLSEREQRIQKIFGRARKLSKNEKKGKAPTVPAKTKSISGGLLPQQKEKLLKDLYPKKLHSEVETASVSFLSQDTTSKTKGISHAIKNDALVKSAPHKAATSESLKHPVWPVEAANLSSFKIPKMVHQAQAEITGKHFNSASTNRNQGCATELSKPETFHQSHICRDGSSPSRSCDMRNETSSSSSHLPDISTTVTSPWQDEVTECKISYILVANETILIIHIKEKT